MCITASQYVCCCDVRAVTMDTEYMDMVRSPRPSSFGTDRISHKPDLPQRLLRATRVRLLSKPFKRASKRRFIDWARQSSSTTIVHSWAIEESRFDSQQRQGEWWYLEVFTSAVLSTQPPVQSVTIDSSVIKRPEREADYWPSDEFKNIWSSLSTSVHLHGVAVN